MASWLSSRHHEVEVLAPERLDASADSVRTEVHDNCTVHRVSCRRPRSNEFLAYTYENVYLGEVIRSLIARGDFDVVHVVSGYMLPTSAFLEARTRAIPVVVTLTEYRFLCARLNLLDSRGRVCVGPGDASRCARCLLEEKRRYRAFRHRAPGLLDAFWSASRRARWFHHHAEQVARRQHALREALGSADAVICPSRFLLDKFAELGFDTKRFVHRRQGLARTPDSLGVTRSEGTAPRLRLGYLGQVKPHKGVDLAIEAVMSLLGSGYSISLDLWGAASSDPRYTASLKARAASEPAIRWHDPYSGQGAWAALAGLDAIVVPSRWYENSPNVILEAYAAGVPVVAANLGGMAELVEHDRSGLLFELPDARDLACQLARLHDEPGLLPRLRNGLPAVKTLDQEMRELVFL